MFSKSLINCLIGLSAAFITSHCFAKNINLYDQPKDSAKIIGTIDTATGVVPIFSPKDSQWMKIGDPHNGNVGWVKTSELANAGTSSNGYSFSQQITTQDNQPQSVIMQFGDLPQLTPEQKAKIYKQAQEQQAIIQKDIQQMMQNMFNNSGLTMPVIMPIVVMPQQNTAPAAPQKKSQ